MFLLAYFCLFLIHLNLLYCVVCITTFSIPAWNIEFMSLCLSYAFKFLVDQARLFPHRLFRYWQSLKVALQML